MMDCVILYAEITSHTNKLTGQLLCTSQNIMYKIVYGDIVAGLRDKMSSIILFVLNCDVIGACDLFF